MSRLLQQTQHFLLKTLDFIGIHAPDCRICGKPVIAAVNVSLYAEMPSVKSLCGDCRASLAWIHTIRCHVCGRSIACDDCRRRRQVYFLYNRSAVKYDPAMKNLLALYKYRGHEALEPLLTDMLVPAYLKLTAELSTRLTADAGSSSPRPSIWDAVTYVPISRERAEERGFNQAERLARGIADKHRLPLLPLLLRTRHSAKQSFKTRSERINDMESLFAMNPSGLKQLTSLLQTQKKHRSSPVRLLLVDDIYTTGSTINACARVLTAIEGRNVEVFSLTWARS